MFNESKSTITQNRKSTLEDDNFKGPIPFAKTGSVHKLSKPINENGKPLVTAKPQKAAAVKAALIVEQNPILVVKDKIGEKIQILQDNRPHGLAAVPSSKIILNEVTESPSNLVTSSDHQGFTQKNDSVVTFTRQFNPLISHIENEEIKYNE